MPGYAEFVFKNMRHLNENFTFSIGNAPPIGKLIPYELKKKLQKAGTDIK